MSENILERLAEPFEPHEVKWKPQAVRDGRALAVAYVDARVVMDRLDDVFGPGGWQDEYSIIDKESTACRLSVKFGDEWITKTDVGSQSEQPDEGDRRKAAFSDALKRAAVKFGIGRYLYRLPHQWVDYDVQHKRLRATPALPPWALPRAPGADTGLTKLPPSGPPASLPFKGSDGTPVMGNLERLVRESGIDIASLLAGCGVKDLASIPPRLVEMVRLIAITRTVPSKLLMFVVGDTSDRLFSDLDESELAGVIASLRAKKLKLEKPAAMEDR